MPNTTLIHKSPEGYMALVEDVYPQNGTNIASSYKIKKGDIQKAFEECSAVVEREFNLKKSAHLAMEIRAAEAEISSDGKVTITSSTQSPFTVKKLLSQIFALEENKVTVKVPFVGGGFGGKSAVFLEIIAFIASQAVGGKRVRVILTREEDFIAPPSRLGLDAKIKIGANKDGIIKAAQMFFNLDAGAYTDISPNMSKAIAVDCTGPYNIENLECDSVCVYTNHNYATAYRGFSHEAYTFCIERVIDILAKKLRN